MALVTKKITSGVPMYSTTDAVGELEFVRRTGVMSCGSGDDYTLTKEERQIVEDTPEGQDVELPAGKFRCCKPVKRPKPSK